MHVLRKIIGPAVGLAAVALIAAACSSGGASSSGGGLYGAGPATTAGGAAMGAAVDLRDTKLGQTLVDAQGRTLYLFEADSAGKSNCHGACASAWPPYLSNGAPQAGNGVAGGQLGTIMRSDDNGGTQVTYHGHPLYYYVGDSEPGTTAGQGLDQFGARWYVVGATGAPITTG